MRGWTDFRHLEINHSEDPVGLAYQALLYLFCPGTKRWDGCVEGLIAFFGFLEDETRTVVSEDALVELRRLLLTDPLRPDEVWEWFSDSFPPV